MGVPGKIHWKYSVKCLCVKPINTLLELEKKGLIVVPMREGRGRNKGTVTEQKGGVREKRPDRFCLVKDEPYMKAADYD